MSDGSRKGDAAGFLIRLLFQSLGWTLLCLSLGDVIPGGWVWGGYPAALILGSLSRKAGFRWWATLAFLALASLVFRSGAVIFHGVLSFDNGWLLTAAYWYLAALFICFGPDSPLLARLETGLLGAFIGFVLLREDDWGLALTAPAMDTLRLGIAVGALLLTALSLGAARRSEEGNGSHPGDSSLLFFRPDRLLHTGVVTLAMVLLLIAGMSLHRERSLRSGGGVLASDLFRFDFNDVLSLEPEISLEAELTMLYREDGTPIPRYLRRYTLSGWDESRGFFRDGEVESDIPGGPPYPSSLPKSPQSLETGMDVDSLDENARSPVRQEYYLVALDPQSLFALNLPSVIEPWDIWDDASFTRAYAVESLVSVAGPWELIDAGNGGMSPEQRDYYLAGGDSGSFREMAEKAVGDAQSDWEKADALERWFLENYYYSLKPGLAPDGDQLSWFLNETRRGYCSYFAFAMTRLCRSLEIPARVAVGFMTDPTFSTLGFVPVRSDQAHAWVEIWLGEYGWIVFDPTSAIMAPGEEYPFAFLDPGEWLPLIEEVLTKGGEVSVSMADSSSEVDVSLWRRVLGIAVERRNWVWLVLTLVFAALYWPGRIGPGLKNLRDRHSSDPRCRVRGEWQHFASALIRCGYPVNRTETPLAWAERLDGEFLSGFSSWTSLYLKAVFGRDFDAGDRGAADEVAAAVRLHWKGLAARRRIRSLVSPGQKGGIPW